VQHKQHATHQQPMRDTVPRTCTQKKFMTPRIRRSCGGRGVVLPTLTQEGDFVTSTGKPCPSAVQGHFHFV
jgi:hypothetical protein